MRLDLSALNYTTLSRCRHHLARRLRPVPPSESVRLVLDSTGLSIVGAGEWAAATHGGRGHRGWRKLHPGVDQSGVVRVHTLTEETGDDAPTALGFLPAVDGPLVSVTGDAAYLHGRRLRDRQGAGCDRRRPTGQDGERFWPPPAAVRAGSDNHVGEDARTASLEEGVRVPSSGSGGEHVLPLQVHHRLWSSRPECSREGEGGRPRL